MLSAGVGSEPQDSGDLTKASVRASIVHAIKSGRTFAIHTSPNNETWMPGAKPSTRTSARPEGETLSENERVAN